MAAKTGYEAVVLDLDDCQVKAQGVLVFARQLLDDCQRDVGGKDVPPGVASQLQRLEETAATLAGIDGLDASPEGMVVAHKLGEQFRAFDVSPAEWRSVGRAMAFLGAGDRANSGRLRELPEKVNAIAGWSESWLGNVEQAESGICDE